MHDDGKPHDNITRISCNSTPSVPFDPEKYRHHIENFNLTYEQQTELLHIVADIMRQFIDLGFNIHPIQCAQQSNQNSVDVVGLLEHLLEADNQSEKGDA